MKIMYKWNATEYKKSSTNQKKWGMELLTKLRLAGSERVLDIGCGDGELTALIAEKLPYGKAVGIDNSSDMVKLAQKNFGDGVLNNLSFSTMDVRQLNFDEHFDIVFSNACLHWVTDHLQVLCDIQCCLNPSGRIILQMGGKGNAATGFGIADSLTREDKYMEFFKDFSFPYGFYDTEEYHTWLAQSGFKATRVELISKDMSHPGTDAFASWVRTTWLPYTQRAPQSLREELIKEIVERYAKLYPPDNNGLVHIQMKRLEVEAMKRKDY